MTDHPVAVPARPPSPEEWQDEVQVAHAINESFANAINAVRESMWEVSRWAYQANAESVWSKIGYETKGEWLATPEIHMTRTTFDRMVRVWRETHVHRQIDAPTLERLDVSKLDIVLGRVNAHEVSIEDAISDVQVLGANDLREKYQSPHRPRPEPAPADDTTFDTDVPEVVEHDDDNHHGTLVETYTDDDLDAEQEEAQPTVPLPDEKPPLEWACDALHALVAGCDDEPWHTVYVDAGKGAEGFQAVAAFALEALDDD
jgi:hypothetical protein